MKVLILNDPYKSIKEVKRVLDKHSIEYEVLDREEIGLYVTKDYFPPISSMPQEFKKVIDENDDLGD